MIRLNDCDFLNLDQALAKIILTSMLEFKKRDVALRDSLYDEKYQRCIYAFQNIANGNYLLFKQERNLEIQRGLYDFAEIFTSLAI